MLHEFYRDKNILITGHTGFKGSWLALWMLQMGARVHGISMEPLSTQDHFVVTDLQKSLDHRICDIRDRQLFTSHIQDIKPQLIFHLAAQPIVLDSYEDPITTYETNIMGTTNLLEAARSVDSVQGIVVITTDKCYENREWEHAYCESDALGGFDPYSSSKAAAEIVAQAYYRSFFKDANVALATARAGNVIGGGDWQQHRLIPDLMRAAQSGETMHIRNPASVRPWQHVLEPLAGYLELGKAMLENGAKYSGAWNFGPSVNSSVPVKEVMNLASQQFPRLPVTFGTAEEGRHEAQLLMLDSSKASQLLGWETVLTLEQTIGMTVEWYQGYLDQGEMRSISQQQISNYEDLRSNV